MILERVLVNLLEDGDRKSLRSFDQGKPAISSGVGDGLESVGVNSDFLGRLAQGVADRGLPLKPQLRVGHP